MSNSKLVARVGYGLIKTFENGIFQGNLFKTNKQINGLIADGYELIYA